MPNLQNRWVLSIFVNLEHAEFANQGFPIPNVAGLKFIKPSLTLGKVIIQGIKGMFFQQFKRDYIIQELTSDNLELDPYERQN